MSYRRLLAPDGVRRVDVPLSMVERKLAEGFAIDPNPDSRPELEASTNGRHKGRPAIVVAGGPSAKLVDREVLLRFCAEQRCVRWAVNDAWKVCGGRSFPADYLVILDDFFWAEFRRPIGAYLMENPGCLPVTCFDIDEALRYQRLAIGRSLDPKDGHPYDPGGPYFHGQSSGIAAIQMAMRCGCGPIYLLGHDLCAHKGASHGFGSRGGGGPVESYPQGDLMRPGYTLLAKHAAGLGVRIVNLSPVSTINDFERAELQGV